MTSGGLSSKSSGFQTRIKNVWPLRVWPGQRDVPRSVAWRPHRPPPATDQPALPHLFAKPALVGSCVMGLAHAFGGVATLAWRC